MKTILFLLLAVAPLLSAQDRSCDLKSGQDLTPERQQKFTAYLKVSGDRAAVLYYMAQEYAKAGNTAKALSTLQEALKDTPWLDPVAEPDFKPLANCPEFHQLVERIENKYPKATPGKQVFTIAPKDLIPEGLAAGPKTGDLFMGSIHHNKVVRITSDGKFSDFIPEGQDGLMSVIGMKVDDRDQSLWLASDRPPDTGALFHFDRNGKLLARYAPESPGKHLFNDLVITRSGDIFVTDSEGNSVFKLTKGASKLERIDLGTRPYPNGIAANDHGSLVYVAHSFGIAILDANTGSISELRARPGLSTASFDGLYFRKGKLLGIQNGGGANRIVELQLSQDGHEVTGGRLLAFRDDRLELPTTGAILNGKFYYIENTYVDLEKDGKITDETKLKPVRISVLPLD